MSTLIENALTVNRGTTYRITFTYIRDEVAGDLTGGAVRFTVKSTEYDEDADDSTALIEKDITDGLDETGVVLIEFAPTDTPPTMLPGTYFYDIKVKDATGDIFKVVEGNFILVGSPTNRIV